MHTLRRHLDPVHAQRLAAHLRSEGVVAGVLHDITSMGGLDFRAPGSSLVLLDRRDAELAEALIREYEADPPTAPIDESMEDADVTRLDPAIEVACPDCGGTIVASLDPRTCPACRGTIEVLRLVVEQHGPEALATLYEDDSPGAFDDAAGVACPACGYWLGGLGRTGACPECATPYDKDILVTTFLNDLSARRYMKDPPTGSGDDPGARDAR
ncbi:MAG: hypothetical protein KF787_02525 [Phycisphaeraceae bacterium]|nr:hypothetical protein [Phycisphaerae bacterium]MBX3391501.1 hypothetical protein [Phycisphaeraceae bacterium]HRJ50243.1 hypothetical protein [Phycisphaerales bacterium]